MKASRKPKFIIKQESTGLYYSAIYGWVSKDRATQYSKRPALSLSNDKKVVEEVE